MIDLKHEIERELSLIDPPDLWDRIQADASNDGDAAVLDLTTARHRRRPSLWLAVAAVTVLLALVGALALLDDHQTVDTTPATEVPVVPEPPTNDDGPTTLAKGEDVEIARRSAGRARRPDAEHRRRGAGRRGDRRVPGQQRRGHAPVRGHQQRRARSHPRRRGD